MNNLESQPFFLYKYSLFSCRTTVVADKRNYL